MALDRQIVSLPFAGGEDTKTDPLQVSGAHVLTMQNGFFQNPKEIRKRFGYSALPTAIVGGGNLTKGQALGTLGNELVLGDGSNLYSLTSGISKWSKVQPGPYIPALLTNQIVATGSGHAFNISNFDGNFEPITNLRCFAYYGDNFAGATGDITYSVVDSQTGEIALTGKLAGVFPSALKVIAIPSTFLIFYTSASVSPGTLFFVSIDSALNVSVPTVVANDLNVASPRFDAQVIGTRIFVAYNLQTTPGIAVGYLLSVGTFNVHNTPHPASRAITIWGDPSLNVWVGWSNATNVYSVAYDNNLNPTPVMATSTVSAQTNINQLTGAYTFNSGSRLYYCRRQNSATDKIWVNSIAFPSGAVGSERVFQRTQSLATKAFFYNGMVFFVGFYCGSENPTYFLMVDQFSGSGTVIAGKFAQGLASARVLGGNSYNIQMTVLPEFPQISSGVFQFPFTKVIPQEFSFVLAGLHREDAYAFLVGNIDLTVVPQTAEIASSLHLTGAQLWLYDGLTITEHGFHNFPVITAVSAPDGGAGIAAGTYIYIATYSWTDVHGQTYTSAPSQPFPVTIGVTSSILNVTVQTLGNSNKGGVQINLYRTTANEGSVWYAVGNINNSNTADTEVIADVSPDSQIIGQPQLYTVSGEVINGSAPACLSLTTFKSRLLLVPSDDPYSWWFSKQVLPSSGATQATPAEFSPFFVENIDQKGGPITGVIAMDDKIVFGKSMPSGGALFYVTGDGPAITGAANDFSLPQVITSPVGIASATSMVLGPEGVMFQAANAAGIWQLSRGLGVSYIGAPVESNNGLTVRWATLVPEYNQIRFLLSNGMAVIYDYFVGQWATYTSHSGIAGVIFRGAYTYLQPGGASFQEANTFMDAGTPIVRTVVTAWLDLSNLNGFQRVRRMQLLGTWVSSHSITISAAYDYVSTIRQSDTIQVSSDGLYEFLIHLAKQKCESIQITIADASGSGEGARWSGLTFEVGAKRGLHKLPPTAAYG